MNPVGSDGYEHHPLLEELVRDIASRGEGVLVAVTHELHSHGTVRIAHIRPASGVEWTTAADNIQSARPLSCGPQIAVRTPWRRRIPAPHPSTQGVS